MCFRFSRPSYKWFRTQLCAEFLGRLTCAHVSVLAFIVPVAAVLLISGLVIPSVRACGNPCGSPIIIDTIGEGFRLTSAQDGVLFDLSGTGGPVQIGWTQR